MKRFVFFFLFVFFISLVYSQQNSVALPIYQKARNAESAGKNDEATSFYKQAVTMLEKEITTSPTNSDVYLVYSWVLFRQKKYKQSIEIAEKGIKYSKEPSLFHESLAESYFYLDEYEKSKNFFEKYLDRNPEGEKVATAYFFLGEIFRLTGKYQHAEIAYGTAVYKEPYLPLWWYRLGISRVANGDKIGAKKALNRAISLRPNYPEAKAALAKL